MRLNHKTIYRLLAITMGLVMIVSLVWSQTGVSPAAAQEPFDLTIRVEPVQEGLSMAELSSTPTFDVGDLFKISIVAQGVPEPGIFGSQFEVQFDPVHLAAVENSLLSGSAMEPVLIARSVITEGLVGYAASRQGNLENLAGDVVLASLTLEALSPTEPPEGQTTTISLENVKLGAKGGIEVPVTGLVGLDVIIRGDGGQEPGPGDIVGQATVEGRQPDNQAGHTIVATGDLGGVMTETTELDGSFFFNDAPADTYGFTADRAGFLAASCAGVAHTVETLTSLEPVTLLAGDIDGSNEIDVTDAVAIGTVFGTTAPDEVADLNADGVVDVLDLILMAVNFGQTSVGNPWLCQPLAAGL